MAQVRRKISWPMGIGIFYGAFVTILIAVLILSTFLKDDLVSNDYYSKELTHQKQIDRERRSNELGYQLRSSLEQQENHLIIHFPDGLTFTEISGKIHLYRPSDAELDRIIPVKVNQNGFQSIETDRLESGNWRMKIFWQNQTGEFFYEEKIFIR